MISEPLLTVLLKHLMDYQARRVPHLPQLARRSPTAVVYFTDAESLQVCIEAEDFGRRLSLHDPTLVQIGREGCAIIYFDISGHTVYIPDPSTMYGITPDAGRTVGGAREWCVAGNVDLDFDNMEVFVVYAGPWGRRGPLGP